MAFMLWGLVLFVVATGWLLQLQTFWGNEMLEVLHKWSAYVLGACALVHVTGALVTSAVHRTNLVKAVITGVKSIR